MSTVEADFARYRQMSHEEQVRFLEAHVRTLDECIREHIVATEEMAYAALGIIQAKKDIEYSEKELAESWDFLLKTAEKNTQ